MAAMPTSTNVSNRTTTRERGDQISTGSPLLRLPREIRQDIFSRLLDFAVVLPSRRDKNKPFVVWWFDGEGRRVLEHSAPLFACRLFYREGLPILRRIRYLIEDSGVATPLIEQMDLNTRAAVRSVTLNRASIEQSIMWEEVCQGLKKLELKDLEIRVEGSAEKLQAIQREGEVLEAVARNDNHHEGHVNNDWSVVEQLPSRKIGWVEDMLAIRGLRRLSVSIPEANWMEDEIRSYVKTRTLGIQVG